MTGSIVSSVSHSKECLISSFLFSSAINKISEINILITEHHRCVATIASAMVRNFKWIEGEPECRTEAKFQFKGKKYKIIGKLSYFL